MIIIIMIIIIIIIIIIASLIKNHATCLKDESFCTFMRDVEAIVNSWPVTAETISDPQYLPPLSPSNLLKMKCKIIRSQQVQFLGLICTKEGNREGYNSQLVTFGPDGEKNSCQLFKQDQK